MSQRKIEDWLAVYGESHQNEINRWIHKICVPLIFISIYWILFCIPIPKERTVLLSFSNLIYCIALIFWFRLNIKVGFLFLLFGIILSISTMFIWIAFFHTLDKPFLKISILIFIIAWIGQFIGHKIEGKKPSFLKDLQFLLIGPIWIFYPKKSS